MMKRLDADVLLTAHHLDDQLETIFYRLFTGRSTRSTLGIDVQSIRNHYTICRPLLEVSKEDIRDYRTNIKFLIMKIAQTVTINMLEMTFAIDYYRD